MSPTPATLPCACHRPLAPGRALVHHPVLITGREAISCLAQPRPLLARTFDVGVWKALQLLGAEARPVVPRAVGLRGVLVLTIARPRVGVVEVAVDGWEDGCLSGPGRLGVLLQVPLEGTACCPPGRGAPTMAAPSGDRVLTAEVGGPPVHAHALVQAGLGVGGHSVAQALTVPTRVAPTRVAHAGLVVGQAVHLREWPSVSAVHPPAQTRPPRRSPPGCGRRRRSGY